MPAIDVSDTMVRKLDSLSGDGDVEAVLWRAMYLYERAESPSE